MPTKTTARPPTAGTTNAGATPRVSRSAPPAPTRTPRLPSRTPVRGKKKPAKGGGGLGGLLTALPLVSGGGKKAAKGRAGGGGKAKPAFALLAAGEGALLGRKQLAKRKADDAPATPAPAPEVYTAPTTAGGGETPLRPPAA